MSRLFGAELERRLRRDGSSPLITYYDRSTGSAERTELSATTFANWVAKTANLLTEEFDVEVGDRIALPLLAAHPGHWVSLIWVAACWQARVVAMPGMTPSATLEVVGPEQAHEPATGTDRLACSLHPLGLGFPAALPAGVIDYAAEVRIQPDAYLGGPPEPDDLGWSDGERDLCQADLVDHGSPTPESPTRSLVVPGEPWPTIKEALLLPVLRDGSAVVVVGGDADDHARLAAAERVG